MEMALDLTIPMKETAETIGRTVSAVQGLRARKRAVPVVRTGPRTCRAWTDDELSVALDSTLSLKEKAEMLGRTTRAIADARKRANQGDPSIGRKINQSPHAVGGRRLLAKSCLGCGWLLDARFYSRNKSRKGVLVWQPRCRWCKSKERNAKPDTRTKSERNLNPIPMAIRYPVSDLSRHQSTWTGSDYAVLEDPTLTLHEKAVALKRTFNATVSRASQIQARSMHESMLPANKVEGQWQIKFPETPRGTVA